MKKSMFWKKVASSFTGADLGGGCRGAPPPPPTPEMTCGFLIQLVFCEKKLCGLLVLKKSKRRVHPLLKKILDPPLSNANNDDDCTYVAGDEFDGRTLSMD